MPLLVKCQLAPVWTTPGPIDKRQRGLEGGGGASELVAVEQYDAVEQEEAAAQEDAVEQEVAAAQKDAVA
ncbi:unnamed protein product [Phytophthora fragariaefolia]|uniref:Unnamed protein product n=1 Tax=Phytophthora fragariaefolia TaxID=1490495 RepID=A0A9W6YBZ2_9STRA|nr:unnamed protein product [Phytophthora fragariaefolia]